MSVSYVSNIVKSYSFIFDGKQKRFFFSADGKKCFIAFKKDTRYIVRKALCEDWMFIGGDNSKGFFDCDFRGCDFSMFDITGTEFTRCKFDYGTFDYSFVSYEGMHDCFFGDNLEYKN